MVQSINGFGVGGLGSGGGVGVVGGDGQGMPGAHVMGAAKGILDDIKQSGSAPSEAELKELVGGVAQEEGVDQKQLLEFVKGALANEAPGGGQGGGGQGGDLAGSIARSARSGNFS